MATMDIYIVSVTPAMICKAFTEWHRRWKDEPTKFSNEQECLGLEPGTYGDDVTPYFLKLLAEVQS